MRKFVGQAFMASWDKPLPYVLYIRAINLLRFISKLVAAKRPEISEMSCDFKGPEEKSSCLQS